MRTCFAVLMIAALFCIGCSGGGSGSPTIPDANNSLNGPQKAGTKYIARTNWGLWQFSADPEAETLDVIQIRTGAMHLNALLFVDLPPLVHLTIESLAFDGNIIDADIGLRHPFLGLTEFTGMDVKGIVFSNGSVSGFTDSDLVMAGEGELRLLNSDGKTRWWNPAEFVDNGTIFGYTDGVLGTPNADANFTSTLNGYKYFCDDLNGTDDPLTMIDPEGRGVFSAGQKNVRHYTIEMGVDGLIFNYAVDASWKYPNGSPPFQAPDDFPSDANQPEAYRIEVNELANSLYFDEIEGAGGDLSLSIDIYDWFDAGLNSVKIEWPGFATQVTSAAPTGGGVGYSTYEVELLNCTPSSIDDHMLLITVESEQIGYQDLIPGAAISAYFTYMTPISGEAPQSNYNLIFSDEGVLQEIVNPEWDDISPALCIETDGDIKMAYNHNKVIANDRAYSYACKSDDGLTWYDFQPSFQSWGGVLANHGDNTKIVADTNTSSGNSWRYLSLFYVAYGTWSTPFAAATEPFPPPIYIDGAHVTTYISRAAEMIQDANGYIYIMGDRNNQLQFKKSANPNYLTQGGAVWSTFPITYIGPGYFSRARCSELAPNDTMYLAYYENDTANRIRIAYNTDTSGLNWDTTTIAYNGASSGTTGAHDPGLDIDPNGDFHVTFVRTDTATGDDQICYVNSTDGFNWSNAVVIATSPDPINDDPICYFQFDSYDWLAAVWQAGDHIYISYSQDGGSSWAAAAQVDSLLPENAQPDFVVTSDGVMHIAWAAMNGTHYDIHYRNAWLELG